MLQKLPLFLLVTFLFSLTISLSAQSTLFPIRKDGKYGYIDSTGKVKIRPKFEVAREFVRKEAVAKKKDKWGIINRKGKWVRKLSFPGIEINGLDIMGENRVHIFGKTEKDEVREGIVEISTGRVVLPLADQVLGSFHEGRAEIMVENDEMMLVSGYIDREGKQILPPIYMNGGEFFDGLAKVTTSRFDQVFIDLRGKTVFKLKGGEHLKRERFIEGMYGYFDRESVKFYGTDGKVLFEVEGDAVGDYDNLEDGLIPIRKDYLWGFIDLEGNWVIPSKFKTPNPSVMQQGFSEGLAQVEVDLKVGYINMKGEWVIEPQYEIGQACKEGRIPVRKNGKWGFIDREGKEILPMEYDFVFPFENGLAKVGMGNRSAVLGGRPGGKVGYINRRGEVVWEPTE